MTSLDPVCGTAVEADPSKPSLSHRGITYHFCSSQCLERFQATPALYTGSKRHEDMSPMPKRRRLRLGPCDTDTVSQAAHGIRQMKGVSNVEVGADNIVVAYDLRLLTLAQIENTLAGLGVALRGGLHGWRRALWRFAESNESENAAQAGTGACCSRPPARLR